MGKRNKDDKIIIDLEDLADDEGQGKLDVGFSDNQYQQMSQVNRSIGLPDKDLKPQQYHDVSSRSRKTPFWFFMITGLMGGLVAWGSTEIIFNGYTVYYPVVADIILKTDIFMIAVAGLLGAALGSARGVNEKKTLIALSGIVVGLLFGLFGGLAGGMIRIVLNTAVQVNNTVSAYYQVIVSALSWGIAGLLIGFGQGSGALKMKQVYNSLVGGLIGGFIGGALFAFFLIYLDFADSIIRLLAIVTLGILMGVALGILQVKGGKKG